MVRNNVSPTVWGPPGWEFLHSITEGYPHIATSEESRHMVAFLHSMGFVLPCQRCRMEHLTFVSQFPPEEYTGSRQRLGLWFDMYQKKGSAMTKSLKQIVGSI